MNKQITIIFGIILVAILILVALPKIKPAVLSGTSMYDSTSTFSQGLIVSGVYSMGDVSSVSTAAAITAAQFCRSNWITVDPTGANDEETNGASISLPTEAALIADCLPKVGSCKEVNIENIATVSARIGVALGDSDITLDAIASTTVSPYIDYSEFATLTACAVYSTPLGVAADTASISWGWILRDK